MRQLGAGWNSGAATTEKGIPTSAMAKIEANFIFITILLDVIGFGIIIPVLPLILKEFTGGDLNLASRYGGWLLFSFSLVQFFSSPVLGSF